MDRKGFFAAFLFAVLTAGCQANAQTRSETSTRAFQRAAEYSTENRGLAVLIMKGDEVIFEDYENGHSASTPWMLASGTKSFSGVILAAAIEDKLVSGFDERVSDTLSEWNADPRRSKITIRQLLSLTSGIDVGQNLRPPTYSAAAKMEIRFEPGEIFQYGPAPFQIFGEVMKRKLQSRNQTVLEYLKERILVPIGLNVARWTLQDGQANLPSGAFLTAREWAKFGLFLKNGGQWKGKQIVKRQLLDELFIGSKANQNYGITFWLNRADDGKARVAETGGGFRKMMGDADTGTTAMSKNGIGKGVPKDLFMAAGAANQRLYIIPSRDLVIVRQGRLSGWSDREFLTKILDVNIK